MSDFTSLSGYTDTDDYLAVAHNQDEISLISVQVAWPSLTKMVKLPDPEKRSPFNRPLRKGHSKKYADYLDLVPRPYTPPIALWTDPANVQIEEIPELPKIGNTRFVVAKFDKSTRDQINILDGQHRIYGAYLLNEQYQEELRRAREHRRRAESLGTAELIDEARIREQAVKDKLARFADMTINVQVALTGDTALAKQIFSDVADNALGISRSILSEYSTRNAFNRASQTVAEQVLAGLIDYEKDSMSRSNPHWLSLKDVVNVTQTLELGLGKRWSMKLESTLNESQLASRTSLFFEGLFDAYPELTKVREGGSAAILRSDVRDASLLASSTTIRILAAAYKVLLAGNEARGIPPMSHEDIVTYFASIPMEAGVEIIDDDDTLKPDEDNSIPRLADVWLDTERFSFPYTSPAARRQDLEYLAAKVVDWARAGTFAQVPQEA